MRHFVLGIMLAACSHPADDIDVSQSLVSDDDEHLLQDEDEQGEEEEADHGPLGFIGSPCETDLDCDYEGSICLNDGFPLGTCSQACDLYCPDRDDHPTTFCVDELEFPEPDDVGDGGCLSRCDFGIFPETGCRPDYGCVEAPRSNEPDTLVYSCLPNRETEISDCMAELSARGVDFTPTTIADTSPSGEPSLTCHVEEPVLIHPPMHGVDLVYYDGGATPNIKASCEMALALSDTVYDVKSYGVQTIRHIGTYNCRTISGTSEVSRHGFGDAIDLYGFEFENGDYYTLIDDWEYTTSFETDAGEWLYDAGYRWHDEAYWNIILTPNFNSAHANHFHVDLTPNYDYIGLRETDWSMLPHLGAAPFDE